MSIDWSGVFAGNGRAVQAYYVWVASSGSAPACTVTGVDEGAPVHTPPPGVVVIDAASTATVVSGLTADTTYRVVVYAYNGQGCTASAEVTATPRERPTSITAIEAEGPVETAEGRWDFRLLDVTTAGGDALDSVQYRLVGTGVDPAESTPAALPVVLTAGTSHYGTALQVEVRGCRQYEQLLCGAWSAPFALGVAVLIDVQPAIVATGEAPNDRSVSISWTP
ncbi:MAG: hypothetical protein B7Y93_08880, partial [Micrococcales bacterium 32-70-13]